LYFSLTVLALGVFVIGAFADTVANAPIATRQSPEGALIAHINQTLQSATSIQADFSEVDSYPGAYKDLKQSGTLTFARPGKLNIDIHRYRRVTATEPWSASGNDTESVSDGSTYWFAFLHPESTQVRHSAAEPNNISAAAAVVPSLRAFFSTEDATSLPGESSPAVLSGSETWSGQSYQVIDYQITGRSGNEIDATAFVGTDNIIHRLIYASKTDAGTVTKEWQITNVAINSQVPDSKFAYAPPANAFPLDTSVSGPLLSPGTEAPDFTVSDASGNPVKLSDFKGKTVILDFWATWCWPCNQSLPHTEEVAENYQGKNVVVLAVAIRDSKKGFDLWLKKHSYPDISFVIDQKPEGQDVASTLYGVDTTPTAFVIDPSGQIVQSIVGYAGPTEELASAVNTAVTNGPKVASAP
jgi:peroxiredoxin/outer membrane lipoprotein-sorting protein